MEDSVGTKYEIVKLKTPSAADSAATKDYVDNNAGGDASDWATFSATTDVDMNSNRMTNLADATAGTDALNRNTADGRFLRRDGNNSMSGKINMSGNNITNVGGTGDPKFDVATKEYVQNNATGGSSLYYNVKDNGATGDGSTDDTSAINSTITQADNNGGGTVYFPVGDYNITEVEITANNITLLGEGAKSRLLGDLQANDADKLGVHHMTIFRGSIDMLGNNIHMSDIRMDRGGETTPNHTFAKITNDVKITNFDFDLTGPCDVQDGMLTNGVINNPNGDSCHIKNSVAATLTSIAFYGSGTAVVIGNGLINTTGVVLVGCQGNNYTIGNDTGNVKVPSDANNFYG
jgi:hypothetical protein